MSSGSSGPAFRRNRTIEEAAGELRAAFADRPDEEAHFALRLADGIDRYLRSKEELRAAREAVHRIVRESRGE